MPSVMNYIQQIQDKAAGFTGTDTLKKYNIDDFSQVHADAKRLTHEIKNIYDAAIDDEEILPEDHIELKAAQKAALQYLNEKSKIAFDSYEKLLNAIYTSPDENMDEVDALSSERVDADFQRARYLVSENHSLNKFHQAIHAAFENKEISRYQDKLSGEYGLATVQAITTPFIENAGSAPDDFMAYMQHRPKPDSPGSFSTLFFDDANTLCSINIVSQQEPPNNLSSVVSSALQQTASIVLSKNIGLNPDNPDLYIYNPNNPKDIDALKQTLNSKTLENWLFDKNKLLNENDVVDYDALCELDQQVCTAPTAEPNGVQVMSGACLDLEKANINNHKPLKPKEPASKPKDTMSRSSCLQTAGAFLACGATGVLSTGVGAMVGGFVGMALGGPAVAAAGIAIGAIAGSAISGVLAKLAGKRAGKAAPDDDFPLDAEEAGRPRGPRGP